MIASIIRITEVISFTSAIRRFICEPFGGIEANELNDESEDAVEQRDFSYPPQHPAMPACEKWLLTGLGFLPLLFKDNLTTLHYTLAN